MGRANTQRHDNTSIMNDEKKRPIIPPAPAKPAHTPIALARSSGGKLDVMMESVTGMIIAAPTPANERATIMATALDANTAATLERPKITRPASNTGLRP